MALLLACGGSDAQVTTLGVRTHELGLDCAISAPDGEPTSDYLLALTALGPFEAEGSDYARNIPLGATRVELGFDARSVGVDAIVTHAAGTDRGAPLFTGHSERRRPTGIDVLLWPDGRACSVAPGAYPGGHGGQALGYSSRAGLVLSAGEDVSTESNEQGAAPGSALAFDADRGTATLVPREGALSVPRAFASVTELGQDLLVAGGENPLGSSSLDAAGTAELFSSSELAFKTTINLTLHRARHAAVTLPATGETLLIGGYEPEPDRPEQRPREIFPFEAVSPALGASISGLGTLSVGRINPTALVLSDGRVFVGGGTSPGNDQTDVEGQPLGLVEWFSADARDQVLYAEPKGRPHRTFAALPGGGVLSVASCDKPNDRSDCACFTTDGGSCEEQGEDFVEGSWFDPDGHIEKVAFVVEGSSARCPTPREPLLAPGSDGSPWLVGAGADGTTACLWRFEPWPGENGGSEARSPRFVPTDVTLTPAPDPETRLTSLGPDAFVWVGGGDAHGLFGVALGHRGALTRDIELLAAAPGEPRPEHLAPDRNPNPAPSTVRRARATFDANNFRLTLEPPESTSPALTVWVTDTTYDDALVSVALALPPGITDLGSLLPVLVFGQTALGDPADGTTPSCVWPTPSSSPTGQLALTATRRGTQVTLASNGSATTRCSVAAGSLALGVRAGTATTTLVSFTVERQ